MVRLLWTTGSNRKLNSELDAGNAAREANNWPAAVSHYRRYLEDQPRAFVIWVQLGHALKESGQLVEALLAYSEARRLNRNDSDLELSLGHLYKLMGHFEEALVHYQRSVEIDGNVHANAEINRLRVS